MKSRSKRALAACLVLLVVGEGGARYVLGLGDPPLVVTDPDIEYLARPSSAYRRFANLISVNSFGMRSGEFPEAKTPGEFRLLVFGDSVVNGGALTDQSELATTLLEEELSRALARTVRVGNISAGSWGPPNMLGYVNRFGLFEADMVVVVLSSHDYADVPTFAPLGPDFPTERPMLALSELVFRYGRRLIPSRASGAHEAEAAPGAADVALSALCSLVEKARDAEMKVVVFQHATRTELARGQAEPGHGAIRIRASACGAQVLDLAPAFAAATRSGRSVYRDDIHPNAEGQRLLADEIRNVVLARWSDSDAD